MRIRRNFFVTLINLLAITWLGIEFFILFNEFSYIIKNDISSFELSIPVMPFITFLVVGCIVTPLLLKNKNQKISTVIKATEAPHHLQGDDERNEQIIGKASRKAYITMWQTSAFAVVFMIFFPFVSDIIPYYPILVLALVPLISSIVYFVSIKKYYLKG